MKNNLYDILSERWISEGGSLFIISDPHFGDVESYKQRGFINVLSKEEFDKAKMDFSYEEFIRCVTNQADEMQIKNINSKCGKLDTLIILGDVGDIDCIKKLKAGYKILIMGNHDKGASNYKRVERFEKIDVSNYLDGKTPNELCIELSDEEQKQYYEEARKKAEREYRAKSDFIRVSNIINYDFHSPFMSWYAYFDNRLFDEVYEGPLMISDRVILSHEPINVSEYLFNVHGHTHNLPHIYDERHLNVCAEAINYIPINLIKLLKKGLLKDTKTIHRFTTDKRLFEINELDKKIIV